MFRWVCAGLFVAGFAAAFALGHHFRNPAPMPVNIVSKDSHPPMMFPVGGAAEPEIIMPTGPASPPSDEPINKNDLTFVAIQKEIGINLGPLVDRNEKKPEVLAQAGRIELPDPPTGPAPAPPRIDLAPDPTVPPLSMATAPKLEGSTPKPAWAIVNDKNLEIDFDVTRHGLSKIKAVELWVTRMDQEGAPWRLLDRKADAKSPFKVVLAEDGVYGFKVAVESESGMRSHPEYVAPSRFADRAPGILVTSPPSSSVDARKPDMRVEVDLTPPKVQMKGDIRGVAAPDTVALTWTVADKNIDAAWAIANSRPEYSVDGKTWTAIEAKPQTFADADHAIGLTTDWRLPAGVPHALFLRVTVRDKAGNEATAELPHRVQVDLVVPEARVKAVRVAGQSSLEAGPAPRVVEPGR